MADAIENFPVVQEKQKDVSSTLSNQSFDSMVQSFSPTPKTTEQLGDYISLNSIFPEEATTAIEENLAANMKETGSLKKVMGGEYCMRMSDVNTADQAVKLEPKLDLRIANADAALGRANDVLRITGDKLRNNAQETFTKQDWAQLNALGGNPFSDHKGNPTAISFNPAQRAWLRANHPDMYKQLENHDTSNLAQQRAASDSNALHAIKDGPVNARLELANYLHRIGDHDSAVATLTEIARSQRTPAQEKQFRNAAQQTDAAWDRGFRKAIERGGGNILDYIRRPERSQPSKTIDRIHFEGGKKS